MSDFLDTVKTKDAVEIRYCYEDGTSPLVTREEYESALADAQCRAEHAQRCHAAELHEAEKRAKALDAENAELRRQLGIHARVVQDVVREVSATVAAVYLSADQKVATMTEFSAALRAALGSSG
jgi:hypothetical protein